MDAETKPVSTSALDILADAANDHCKTESETSNQANQTIISTSTAKRSAKAVPTPRNRTRAEQIRREALEESLTEYFPVENVRAVERMTDKEIVDSKNLVMCFLSGRAPPPPASADEETANDDEDFDAKKDINSRYVNEYQHDLSDLTRSYHYKYDPSLPLPPSFLDRPRPPAEKKRNRADDHKLKDKQTKKKRQKSKTKESFEERHISKIDGAPLLLAYPQPNESIGHDTDEDGACEATYISNVPAIVNIKDNNVTDESVHSSVVADEASVLTTNPTSYSFEWDQDNKGWRCKRCSSVPPFFQAADAFIPGSSEPSPKSMHTHKNACLGEKADLTKALDMVLKMVRSSTIKFKHITSAEFKSIVRLIANENEEYVTLFTTDLRNRWLDPLKKVPLANVDWNHYPVKTAENKSPELCKALVLFARKMGLGFDFVSNEYFVKLFNIISPDCCLPEPHDLISSW